MDDMFVPRVDDDSTDSDDIALTEMLRDMWQCRLRVAYRDRSFDVLVLRPEESGGSVGITFYEVRSSDGEREDLASAKLSFRG
jgi:hypothetical protein